MSIVGGALVLTVIGILLFGTARMIGRMGLIVGGIILLVVGFFGLEAHLHSINEAEDAAKQAAETAQWDATCTKIKTQYGNREVAVDSPDWIDWMVCKRHVITKVEVTKPVEDVPTICRKAQDGQVVCNPIGYYPASRKTN